jgi:hypothetical protein
MNALSKKLLLVIPIRDQEDLMPVVNSEGWYTLADLFKKTSTSYNSHWNGNYVLDQDEIPWKVTPEELASLQESSGQVVAIIDAKYHISERIPLYTDRDGSVYALEEHVAHFFA